VPAREIAADLGIPVFTVYSRIRAVREGLRNFLTGHEVEK
jgi:DNA-directed RNA polymerase specialized sigma24 family protein